MQVVPSLVSPQSQPFWSLLVLLCVMLDIRFSSRVFFPGIAVKEKAASKLFSPFSERQGLVYPLKGVGMEVVGWPQEGNVFGWYCLAWSHPCNHQSPFRGKVQTTHFLFYLSCGTSWRRQRQSLGTSEITPTSEA